MWYKTQSSLNMKQLTAPSILVCHFPCEATETQGGQGTYLYKQVSPKVLGFPKELGYGTGVVL